MQINRKTHLQFRHFLVALTLALLFAVPLSGQNTQPAPTRDNDTTTWQLEVTDSFLDSHPEIAQQLRKDPSLIQNKQFVDDHPALQEFLQQHPGVREEFAENPNAFMRQEQRFDRNDTTRGELATMDRFFDTHPEIAEQLRKDPSLIKNKEFVDNHPALQEFLQTHAGVREEFIENPNAFMHQEERYDRNDATRGELANMDRFLDSHTEIAEQLRKNPSLINDKEFVNNHPELQAFLETHPGVREEFTENPSAFMRQEERFDQREDQNRDVRFGDRDTTRGELAAMDRFLDSHTEIEEQLRKDPSLIKNKQFVENHPALQEFLQTHQGVREEFSENPQAFMRQEQRYDRNDVTRGELANMDRFLDNHTEIAEQLRKDPSLIKNKQFVESHPALQEFLQNHAQVREEFTENPQAFMRREQRFEHHEDTQAFRNRDRNGIEMGGFGQFLGGQSGLAQQLAKDPSLANNKEFLDSHPQFRDYLNAHPALKQRFMKEPQSVMSSPELAAVPKPGAASSPKLNPNHQP